MLSSGVEDLLKILRFPQTVNLLRPFALLLFMTFRPFFVLIFTRNPRDLFLFVL